MRRLALALSLLWVACATTAPPRPRHDRTLQLLDRLSESVEGVPEGARWRMMPGSSFNVFYLEDPLLAGRVLHAAEAARNAQQRLWYGAVRAPWSPRCDIHLFPTRRLLTQFSGGDSARAGSAASRRSKLLRGKTLQRVMYLTADEPCLLDDVVPHEVSHLILGGLMGVDEPARWADEGLAVLAMSDATRGAYDAVLRRFRARGQLFELRRLVVLEVYPDPPFRQLFYAQSMSVVGYLLARGDRERLLGLLRGGPGLAATERGLRRLYGIRGALDLQRRWLAWLDSGAGAPGGPGAR